MIGGVMIVKSGEKVQLVPNYKPTTLLYFIFTTTTMLSHYSVFSLQTRWEDGGSESGLHEIQQPSQPGQSEEFPSEHADQTLGATDAELQPGDRRVSGRAEVHVL